MHQIHFLLGLCPRPPGPCLYLRGLLLRGWRETGEGEEKVKGNEGKRWRELAHPNILEWRPQHPSLRA